MNVEHLFCRESPGEISKKSLKLLLSSSKSADFATYASLFIVKLNVIKIVEKATTFSNSRNIICFSC